MGFFPLFLGRVQPLANCCVFFPLPISTHWERWIQSRRSHWGGILGAFTRSLHLWDQSLLKLWLYDLRESWQRSSSCCRNFTWPWIGHEGGLWSWWCTHWEAGVSSSSMGEGAGHPRPNPVEFLFYHQSIFVPLIFFPFPSGYRTLSK